MRGRYVILEPLHNRHVCDLAEAGAFASIWRWLPSRHDTNSAMQTFVEDALASHRRGLAVAFAIVDIASGKAIGSTRYHFIAPEHRRLEIGFTWITPAFQRTRVNADTKLLLLRRAFETLRYRRVEFKVDVENQASRAAVLRLGAHAEGLIRQHMLYPDGRNRDSILFSIIDTEWPAIEYRLQRRVSAPS